MQQRMLDQISHLGMVGLMILGARFLRIPHFMMKLKNDFSFPLPKEDLVQWDDEPEDLDGEPCGSS